MHWVCVLQSQHILNVIAYCMEQKLIIAINGDWSLILTSEILTVFVGFILTALKERLAGKFFMNC